MLDQFKEDVFGGQEQIGPCLTKIEEQIKAKYEIIKTQFLRKFEKQLQKVMQPFVNEIESKIRLNAYKGPQEILDDINELKQQFLNCTSRSKFKNKELILSQECERLTFKAMEHLYMSLQNNVNGEKRQLEERVNYLEQQIQSNKQAASDNEQHLRLSCESIQQELQKAIAS